MNRIDLPRIMIAAPSSGSGKTMITCGILAALQKRGENPSAFKCGPDYIDPMFHTQVLGTSSGNLDPFFTEYRTTRYLFAKHAKDAGISVMEGVMGLYDGLGGVTAQASSYDLAQVTQTPIVLVVNAKGMSLSVVPFLKGFADYERTAKKSGSLTGARSEEKEQENLIRGVILNRTTQMTYRMLKPVIEEQTGLNVYGYVPPLDVCRVESRHLGLVTPDEIQDLCVRIDMLAEELEKSIDLDGLVALGRTAQPYGESELALPEAAAGCRQKLWTALPETADGCRQKLGDILPETANRCRQELEFWQTREPDSTTVQGKSVNALRIGVARDEAFCFYYRDNLELLEFLGAELVLFSPLHDTHLPEGISALLLGGGYPELYAKELSKNSGMRREIKEALLCGMPYLAECGGFMYLHDEMEDMEGKRYPMVGIVKGASYRTDRLGRFGYLSLSAKDGQLLPEHTKIRGHEFHYFDSTDCGSAYTAVKPVTGRTWSCIHGTQRSAAGYPHLHYWSNPAFAAAFISQAIQYKMNL